MTHRIGLLATGTELTTGDVLNTNAQQIALELTDNAFPVGMHMVVSDAQADIHAALTYLLLSHDVIIITGGLGPTTDDRTRFVLADVIALPLEFHQQSWDYIVQRLSHYGLEVTENNRQQALFPAGASVFHNGNGTANGCKISVNYAATKSKKTIYLLPGPPNECLPMFKQHVLPDIASFLPQNLMYKKKWRLFNVSESNIADKLESALQGLNVTTGYRIDYPYLEFKVEAPVDVDEAHLLAVLLPIIQPYFLSHEYIPASQLLKEKLADLAHPILILDTATGGLLQTAVSSQENHHTVFFSVDPQQPVVFDTVVTVAGLAEYWEGLNDAKVTSITLSVQHGDDHQQAVVEFPYRPIRVVKFAVELAASHILRWLEMRIL